MTDICRRCDLPKRMHTGPGLVCPSRVFTFAPRDFPSRIPDQGRVGDVPIDKDTEIWYAPGAQGRTVGEVHMDPPPEPDRTDAPRVRLTPGAAAGALIGGFIGHLIEQDLKPRGSTGPADWSDVRRLLPKAKAAGGGGASEGSPKALPAKNPKSPRAKRLKKAKGKPRRRR